MRLGNEITSLRQYWRRWNNQSRLCCFGQKHTFPPLHLEKRSTLSCDRLYLPHQTPLPPIARKNAACRFLKRYPGHLGRWHPDRFFLPAAADHVLSLPFRATKATFVWTHHFLFETDVSSATPLF